jgi:hypothetical protein
MGMGVVCWTTQSALFRLARATQTVNLEGVTSISQQKKY